MCLRFVLVKILLLTVANAALTTTQLAKPKPDCLRKCGDLEILYPFGTEAGCFLNEAFLITCNSTHYNPPRPFLRKSSSLVVTDITIDGRLQVQSYVSKNCYDEKEMTRNNPANLRIGRFAISDTKNKFTVIGCDSYGYIRGTIGEKSYSEGCISWCERRDDVTDGSCSGSGCCQIDIPKGLKQIKVQAYSFKNHSNVLRFNPCSYAFVIEDSQFHFSTRNLSNLTKKVPTAVDWAITGQGNCIEAESNPSLFACKENSLCYEPTANNSAGGYLCKCQDGYQGNPYLPDGCKDIDECELGKFKCHHQAICINIQGSYTCECFKGYEGDGKIDGKGCTPNQLPVAKISLGVSLGFLMLLVVSSWIYFMLRKRRLNKLKEKFFQQNGGFLLQQQLSKRSGTRDTARIFSAEELKKATNNFDEKRIVGRGGYGTVYKGFLIDNNNPVAIKKSKIVDQSQIEQFINESSLFEILENDILNDDNREQIKEVAELARMCLSVKGEERPTMKEVAMELEGMIRMNKHLWVDVEVNKEETEHLLSETSFACNYGDGSNSTAAYDSTKDHTLVAFDGGR
ncbi:hypothetical protein LWI28_018207 [Acer negundo]|uniref:Uncharacterized protein n=1 Tax=Acer negundo TaxID=4023 RepID=A0AAD5NXS1_ACENE|nr:hypothetical protein LWI28_018207 [Acer negundo]